MKNAVQVIRRVGGLEDKSQCRSVVHIVIRRVGGLEVHSKQTVRTGFVIRRVGGLEDRTAR